MLQTILVLAIPTVLTLTAAFFLMRNVQKNEERQQRPNATFHRPESATNSHSASTRRRRVNRSDPECAICMERKPAAELYPCGHKEFCADCINKIIEDGKRACPLCRQLFQGYSD